MTDFLKTVEEHFFIYDGAMGTDIQKRIPLWITIGAGKIAVNSWY